jgi:YD repeat-containing protein
LTEPIFYRVRLRGGVRYLLNCHGHIVQERDRNHNAMTFAYGQGNPKTLYRVVDRAVDTVGDRHQFGYTLAPSGMPRLTSLAELDGKRRMLTFEYDQPAMDTLLTVKLAEGAAGTPELRYAYVAGGRPGLLERISDPHAPNASPECATVENRYVGGAGQERVVRQRVGTSACGPTCGGEFVIDYAAGGRVTVTDRAGVVTRYRIDAGTVREMEVDDVTSVGGQIQRIRHVYDYDRHFHLVLYEWPSGRKERFQYRNRNRRVQAGDERDKLGPGGFTHALDLARDDLLRRWSESPSGTAAFETEYRYERLFNAPTRASAPHGTVRLDYDHGRCSAPERNGNPIRVVAPPQLLPDGSRLPVIERREYGLGGRLIMRRDPDGVTETFDLHRTGQVVRHLVGGRLVASYGYDEVGNPVEHRDQRDALTTFAYDARDNLVRTTDPLGHQVAFGYDRSDRLVWRQRTVSDDATPITGIPPSPQRLVLETFTLDAIGSVRAATEIVTDLASGVPTARGQQWDFDGEGRLTAMRSARATSGERADAATSVAYNVRGLVQERKRAGGRVVRSYYDVDGNLSLVIDASGRQVTFDYDEFGRIATRTVPGGTVEHFEYDGHEQWREWVEGPVSVTAANPSQRGVLRETRVRRDASGRPVVSDDLIFDPAAVTTVAPVTGTSTFAGLYASAAVSAGGVVRTRTWYTPGGRISRVDAPGNASTLFIHRFAAQGQLDRIELPAGHSVGFTYDGPLVRRKTTSLAPEPGQVVSPAQAPLSLTEEELYDELGRVVRRTDASGLVTELAYDSLGRVRAERTPSGLRTRQYDAFGREARIEIHGAALPGGTSGTIVQTRAHDANDNPVSAVDALGRETTFAYDGNDEPERMQIPFRGTVTVTRNPDGSVARTTMGANRSVSMAYDAAGRINEVTADEGLESTIRRFLSDGLGRVTSAMDDNGGYSGTEVTIERRYDSLGRMTAERVQAPGLNFDQTVEQAFDLGARRRRLIYPQANPELEYELTKDGNLSRLVRNGVTLLTRVNQGPARVLEQTQKIVVDVQQPTPTAIRLDLTEARRYDDFGRLDWRSLWLNDALVPGGGLLHIASSEWLAYGPDGGLERKSIGALLGVPDATRFSRSEFQHDGAGRMVSSAQVQGDDRRTTRFQWDGANVLREIGEETVQAGTTTAKTTSVSYPLGLNTTDRLSSSPDGEDAFTFDNDGRVRRALHRPVPGAPADVVRDFEFDPFDRLRRCSVTRNGFGRTFEYLYDAFGRLTARTEAGATGTSRSTLFVSHDGRPIAEYDALSRRRRTYVYDLHGQLVDYRSRETERIDAIPVAGIDGGPWFTLRRRFGLQRLPAATGSSTAERVRYYAEAIPLIIEEHRAHLFVDAPIRRFDVVNGRLQVTPVSEGIVPVTAGGRRSFGDEGGIALVGERWFDPALREFMSPNAGGPWRDALSLGHERSYGGNSPVMRGDDGGPAVVPLIVGGLLLGGVIGLGYAIGRQSVQILEGSRDSFDVGEIAWTAAFGAGLGVAVALLPATVAVVGGIMLVGFGAANTAWEYQSGKIGGWTALYDAAAMALPFGRRPLKAWWLNRGSRNAFERMAALRELPADEQLSRLPRFLFEEEAMFVIEQAARTNHPNEVALITSNVSRSWLRGYRTIEGGPESVDVPGEWTAIAHNHPATHLIHRLPAPTDINRTWVRGTGSWIKSQRAGVSNEPAHSQYRIVGEGDASRVRIRPDFPEDFRGLVDMWERNGLARWVGQEIEFLPRQFYYRTHRSGPRAGRFVEVRRADGRAYGRISTDSSPGVCGYQHAYLLARFGYLPPV